MSLLLPVCPGHLVVFFSSSLSFICCEILVSFCIPLKHIDMKNIEQLRYALNGQSLFSISDLYVKKSIHSRRKRYVPSCHLSDLLRSIFRIARIVRACMENRKRRRRRKNQGRLPIYIFFLFIYVYRSSIDDSIYILTSRSYGAQ